MELPHMGEHCTESSCKRLDYLPMKCDACEQLYCKDHLLYDDHSCTSKYKKDIQVALKKKKKNWILYFISLQLTGYIYGLNKYGAPLGTVHHGVHYYNPICTVRCTLYRFLCVLCAVLLYRTPEVHYPT